MTPTRPAIRAIARRAAWFAPLAVVAAVGVGIGAHATARPIPSDTPTSTDGRLTLHAKLGGSHLTALATHYTDVEVNAPKGITIISYVTGAECATTDSGDTGNFHVYCDSSAAGKAAVIHIDAYREGDYGTTLAEQRIVTHVGQAGPVALSTDLVTIPADGLPATSLPAGKTREVAVTSEPGAKLYANVGSPGDHDGCSILDPTGRPLGWSQFHADVPPTGKVTVPIRCDLDSADRTFDLQFTAIKGDKPYGNIIARALVAP